ncbi:hypothetical protein [Cupriavidus pauculus]|uniref:Uncharacterized protein n=1 Tax=Cupriavidus pauculus TaxID=82633 RepID=A0A2N5C443_9BURK|nr:hypothetical protein [Cupriavidus pauculus]PLP96985.1 hypothetical protein CYJ10_29525 [Cupriavidus pauculus]
MLRSILKWLKPSANSFAESGYIGCVAATLSFGIAVYFSLRAPGLITDQNSEVIDAALAAAAASLCAIALAFESNEWIPGQKSEWLTLLVGICGLPVFVWIFAGHNELAWAAIVAVVARNAVVIWRTRSFSAVIAVGASALVGYWAFLLTYVDGYKTPWVDDAVLSGTAHVDMMFHAAIVNMLQGFNAGSLGVDGITPFPYHFASHHLAGLLSHIMGISALEFYAVVFPLLFAPLFLLAMFVFAMAFRGYLGRIGLATSRDGSEQEVFGPFWVALFTVFVGLISASYRRDLGVWDNVFHSESFGVAVLVAYLPGIWLLDQLGRSGPVRLRWYAFPLIALYLIVLCSLKISVGAVIGGLLAYAVLRLPMAWPQRLLSWLAMSCAVVYGYVVTQVVTRDGNAGPGFMDMIKPFAFIRDILPPDRWPPSFLAFFGPTILFVAARLYLSRSVENRLRLRDALREMSDLEMILVLLAISITPGLILSIPQGATNFFAEVSYWWVQPMLAVVLSSIVFAAMRPLRFRK